MVFLKKQSNDRKKLDKNSPMYYIEIEEREKIMFERLGRIFLWLVYLAAIVILLVAHNTLEGITQAKPLIFSFYFLMIFITALRFLHIDENDTIDQIFTLFIMGATTLFSVVSFCALFFALLKTCLVP